VSLIEFSRVWGTLSGNLNNFFMSILTTSLCLRISQAVTLHHPRPRVARGKSGNQQVNILDTKRLFLRHLRAGGR
jgi:hypothetical protein